MVAGVFWYVSRVFWVVARLLLGGCYVRWEELDLDLTPPRVFHVLQ